MPTGSRCAAARVDGVEVEGAAASPESGSSRWSPVSGRVSDFSASISGKLVGPEVLDALRGAGGCADSVSHRVADVRPGISPLAPFRTGLTCDAYRAHANNTAASITSGTQMYAFSHQFPSARETVSFARGTAGSNPLYPSKRLLAGRHCR